MVCRGYDLMLSPLTDIHGKPLLLRASITKLPVYKYKKGATMISCAFFDMSLYMKTLYASSYYLV